MVKLHNDREGDLQLGAQSKQCEVLGSGLVGSE